MSSKRPAILGALVVTILVGLLVIWFRGAATNEDPIWFVRSFNAKADWIAVYWDGMTCTLFPGDSEYDTMMEAFSEAVAHWSGYEGDVSMSVETLEQLRQDGRLLEFHYNEPVRVHTRHPFSRTGCFFVPLSGPHAEWRRIFAGSTDEPRVGVLNMDEPCCSALQQAAEQAMAKRQTLP